MPFGVVEPDRRFDEISMTSASEVQVGVGEGRGLFSRSADGENGRSGEGTEGRVPIRVRICVCVCADGAVDGRAGSGFEGGALLGGGRLRGRGSEQRAGHGVSGRAVFLSLSPLPPDPERE
jgi:hypothetical protein